MTLKRFGNTSFRDEWATGRKRAMIESPVLMQVLAERAHKMILRVLKDRFGPVPKEITDVLKTIQDEERLELLNSLAATCGDFETFRQQLAT